jgi:four helix bundle protein
MEINKYTKKQINIHDRIYKFVISAIKFSNELSKNPSNNVIIHQFIKSATSMGANDQEADGTQSKRDFIAKYSIVKKETKETIYWLKLISDTNPNKSITAILLIEEATEILKIISTIIFNTKKKL